MKCRHQTTPTEGARGVHEMKADYDDDDDDVKGGRYAGFVDALFFAVPDFPHAIEYLPSERLPS